MKNLLTSTDNNPKNNMFFQAFLQAMSDPSVFQIYDVKQVDDFLAKCLGELAQDPKTIK